MKNANFSVNKKSSRIHLSSSEFNEKKELNKYISKNIISNRKSFITVLLKLIKESQAFHLTENSHKDSYEFFLKNSFDQTKNNLIELKNKLILIQTEKNKELINVKNEINNRKEKLYDLKKFNGIQKDIHELKNMNFQYENEIKKLDNLIEHKNKSLFLSKSYECFLEMFNERFYLDFQNEEEIDRIYIEKKENSINKKIYKRNEIFLIEQNIEKIKTKINNLKYKIYEKGKYINSPNIINEDAKQFSISELNEKIYETRPHIKKKINCKFTLYSYNNKLNSC